MPEKRRYDDLLTLDQVAQEFGYTAPYLRMMLSEGDARFDANFRRLQIRTDPTWRKAFNSKAQYVFRYGDVVKWFNDHQNQPSVRRYNESRGIIVE